MSRTVLVTGGSGRLGQRVVAELDHRGWSVRALARARFVPRASEIVTGDLERPASLRGLAEGTDAIVHLAAVTHARRASRYASVNVAGTRNLLEEARRASVRSFVYISTRAIGPGGGAYSNSKRDAEELVRASGVPFTILRLAEVYGLDGEGVDKIFVRARRGARILIPGAGRDELCPVHVDDVTAAIAAALERTQTGATYTLAGDCLTARELAERAAGAFGRRPRVVLVPEPVLVALSTAARVLPLPLYPDQRARLRSAKESSADEAAADLGFRPRPLDDGLSTISPGRLDSGPVLDRALTDIAGARNYNDWLFSRARPHLGQRVLDAGAGIGTFVDLALRAGAEVTALEPDPAFATRLRERYANDARVTVVEADLAAVPAEAAGFDSVLCLNVLEHVQDDGAAAGAMLRALRPGGSLLLLVPAHPRLYGGYDRAAGHVRRYTRDGLRDILLGAGFEIRTLKHVNPVGAIGWLARVRTRRDCEWPSQSFALFDRLVPALRRLDALPLPFGLSLWSVAQRPRAD